MTVGAPVLAAVLAALPPTAAFWSRAAPCPLARFEAAGAQVQGRLYVIGGLVPIAGARGTGFRALTRVDVYEPAAGTWSAAAPLPAAVTHAASAEVDDHIWLTGGFEGDHPGSITGRVHVYDAKRDRWLPGPPLPSPRAAGGLALLGRHLHYVGGVVDRVRDAAAEDGSHFVLDVDRPDAGWRRAAPLPMPRNHFGTAVVGGQLYVVGGAHGHDDGPRDVTPVHAYDPRTDRWSARAPMPGPRSHFEHSTLAVDGGLLVVGGTDRSRYWAALASVVAYDAATDAWRELPALPRPVVGPVARRIGDTIVATTGLASFDGEDAVADTVTLGLGAGVSTSPGGCAPYSPLPCGSVVRSLPVELAWPVPGASEGLADRAGVPTGFTLAQPPSAPLTQDPDAPRPDVPGWVPGMVAVVPGGLAIDAARGVMTDGAEYKGNSQVNGAAVAVDGRDGLVIETAIEGLPRLGDRDDSAEAGLWMGRGEADHVRFVVVATREGYGLELAVENADVSGPDTDAGYRFDGAAIPAGAGVRLRLTADPVAGEISAAYATGPEWQDVGVVRAGSSVFSGALLPGDDRRVTMAGIYTTRRHALIPSTFRFRSFSVRRLPPPERPRIVLARPSDGTTAVPLTIGVVTDFIRLVDGAGIDPRTLTPEAASLHRHSDGRRVPAVLNTSGGFDVLTLQPREPLQPLEAYEFRVTEALKDQAGRPFRPFLARFVTGPAPEPAEPSAPHSFARVPLPLARGDAVTAMALGPDGRLYAALIDGRILRFRIRDDGTLAERHVLDGLVRAEGGPRLLLGLAFDPGATAAAPVAWVSHSHFDPSFRAGREWSGKITRLSGPDLATVRDVVVGLPRSALDHATNGVAFGPDGALYVSQGSNTDSGAPSDAFKNRPERRLSAAILRLDVRRPGGPRPLDVRTEDGGTYDPSAPDAPLTLFATGVRNAFSLLWHSNGRLYAPVNGSNGGPLPEGPSSTPPEGDRLLGVERGRRYGHPNPARGEMGRDGERLGLDLGIHVSPNGIVELRSSAFAGALRGRLLIARFSQGDDVIVVRLGADGTPEAVEAPIPGLQGFSDPLALLEDPRTGRLYVSEVPRAPGLVPQVWLLRPAR